MAAVLMDQALADRMVANAVLFCADKKFGGDVEQARLALGKGRCDACQFLSYSLVRQVGEYLGQVDRTVKAVYTYRPDRAPHLGTATVAGGTRNAGINLIAWVDRRSAALTALGSTLEKALFESRRQIGCANATPACCNLDIQMVDDGQVQEGRGLGAIVQSMYVRSVQVWSRVEEAVSGELERIQPGERGALDLEAIFNPETAPEELLLEQALAIERMSPGEQTSLKARLQEEKVVLIRRIISDQLAYINIAKEWFTVQDLVNIRKRKIGEGKIGGKSAGLLLAERILRAAGEDELRTYVKIPDSYFLGSDLIYIYMSSNGLTHWNDQKYKPEEQMRAEYPRIIEEFQQGEFPPDILEKLQALLDEIGPQPVIARSSSQLEDNFGTSFAGKYDSFFCPNQGSRADNLRALTRAIARTYASTLKPDALLYRRSKGLQDYDERMAVLVQVVQGERFGRWFLPHGAGVAFSRNLYRWAPQIRREAGFTRMVWGLGTRAVDRQVNDFPRLVALSHPNLQPDDSPEAIRHYSQQMVDLIDLEDNQVKTLPVRQALKPNYPILRYLGEIEEEGYFVPIRSLPAGGALDRVAITFSGLLKRTPFAARLSRILAVLEKHYHGAVDLEYTFQVQNPASARPEVALSLLQCRPQSHLQDTKIVTLPKELARDEILFSTRFMVPQGYVERIRYVAYVPPEAYYGLCSESERNAIGRVIGKLNNLLEEKSYICVGPGRWGTNNTDLGVYVSYADIHRSAALVELSGPGIGPAPEPSLGTHFFQDLMEAQIYPLAVLLDKEGTIFNRAFFYDSPSCLDEFLPAETAACTCLRLIEVARVYPGCWIDIIMDDEKGEAVAFLSSR